MLFIQPVSAKKSLEMTVVGAPEARTAAARSTSARRQVPSAFTPAIAPITGKVLSRSVNPISYHLPSISRTRLSCTSGRTRYQKVSRGQRRASNGFSRTAVAKEPATRR